MSIAQNLERKRSTADIRAIYKWIQKRLEARQDRILAESIYNDITQDNYSPKYIIRHLTEKGANLRAFFYFRNMNDYITLSTNGQLNVRGGEESLFKAWGASEFRDNRPQTIFQELENKIRKINVIPFSSTTNHSFSSYAEFIKWLTEK